MSTNKRKLFGTDGVRGEANTYPMTADIALRLGAAVGRYFRRDKKEHRVVIGKDTRRSSYMIEYALTAGLTSTGMNVLLLGPVPTPAVGMLTRSMRADLGVMISASHNKFSDNGIKFFGPDGFKLTDEAELEIEDMVLNGVEPAKPENIGRAKRIDDGLGRYMEFAKTAFPGKRLLDGLRVVIDCANGAAYKGAPEILWELGAEVIPLGTSPNGFNINKDCGSTAPEAAQRKVLETGADIGICLDGDADRVLIIDEQGRAADGDQIMALIATSWADQGRLTRNTLVATIMSNMGLERHLEGLGLTMLRTNVGDRYVVEAMRQGGYNLGGEQSGHIVMSDYVTTGDGLIAGLQFLAAMVASGKPASALSRTFTPFPQRMDNIRITRGSAPLEVESVSKAILAGEARMGQKGRLVIRPSGTEPMIRVMGECENTDLLNAVIDDICGALRQAAPQG